MADWKNRIIKYAEVDPGELTPNPLNWRVHPKQQADALAGLIETVGWVDDVIVNVTTGNILDGHLRVKLAQERNEPSVPVKYVQLSEAEENLVLASFDPITGLAEMDTGALAELLGRVDMQAIEDDGLAGLLEELGFEAESLAQTELGEAPNPSARKLGDKRKQIKPVLYADEIADFERALRATGKANRGAALLEVCRFYLEEHEEGQLDDTLKSILETQSAQGD